MTRPFASLAHLAKPTPPVDHIEALTSLMDRRAYAPLTEDQQTNVDSVIDTYKRLYVGQG